MVRKVVMPAITSVRTEVTFLSNPKSFSNMIRLNLESPFHGQGRQPVPAFHEREIRGYLPFGSQAQVEVLRYTFELVQVHPKLGFSQEHIVVPVAFGIGMFLPPEVGKTAEGTFPLAEMQVPRGSQLETVGRRIFLNILVHGSKGKPFGEGRIVPGISGSQQVGVVDIVQSAVILHVHRKGRFPEFQLTEYLPISTCHTVFRIVHVDKEIGASPTVGLEHFHRCGHFGTGIQGMVKGAAEVVMQLDVLRSCHHRQQAAEQA